MLCVDHTAESIDKDVVVIAVAVPLFEFFKVAVEMLGGYLVERPDDGTLEQSSKAVAQ